MSMDASLSEKEKETLSWLIHGKTNWEISIILGVTERCIAERLKMSKIKLCASTRVGLAMAALKVRGGDDGH